MASSRLKTDPRWRVASSRLKTRSALARGELALPDGSASERLTPQRYKVQFTASEEYVRLVEEAKALLSHSVPRAGLDEINLRAMRALVAELERQKYAVTARPHQRARVTPTLAAPVTEAHGAHERVGEGRAAPVTEGYTAHERVNEGRAPARYRAVRAGSLSCSSTSRSESERAAELVREWEPAAEPATDVEHVRPRWRERYVAAGIRRSVFARDEGRCTHTADSGQRCRETHELELHHLKAFAQGGAHSEENLTLRCRAHNDLAAEKDFGRDFIELARDSTEHEPWATQGAARGDNPAGPARKPSLS